MVKIRGLVSALALGFGAVALSRMIFKKEKVETAVKKTIETPVKVVEKAVEIVGDSANEVKKASKKLIKGSPEAKERMAKMRASANFKRKRGTGKRAMAKKRKMTKAEAGAMGGQATKELGKHKGHKSKKGLAQDQKNVSREPHEVDYQNYKNSERLKSL